MKMIFPLLDKQLDFSLEDKINAIVIENQKYFLHFLTELWKHPDKQSGEIVFSKDNVPLDMSKRLEILDTFVPFDINKKNLLSKLYQKAEALAFGEDFYTLTREIIGANTDYLMKLMQELPFSLDISPDFDVSYIMKAADMRFDMQYGSLAEAVIDYMETVNNLEQEKCFVLVNIRNYIGDEEIDAFYKTILYKKLTVFIVSASEYPLSQYEKRLIVDKDLCVI